MARNFLLIGAIIFLAGFAARAPQGADDVWRFAVSGDSRNCGDVVMPAIAKSVLDHHALFYWHLGDFRLGTGIDEDIEQPTGGQMTLDEYHKMPGTISSPTRLTPSARSRCASASATTNSTCMGPQRKTRI